MGGRPGPVGFQPFVEGDLECDDEVWVLGILVVSNVWKTPTYKMILAGDPEAMPADWEATRQRYFTINWIQLATTWAAFALFLVALISL